MFSVDESFGVLLVPTHYLSLLMVYVAVLSLLSDVVYPDPGTSPGLWQKPTSGHATSTELLPF